jgi:chaperonin GroEL
MPKIRIEHENSFQIILSALRKMTNFIAPTFGPAANKVIIDRQLYRMVVDDGVQIARDFELEDTAENAVIKIIKEVAIKTNDRVGDGTTGSLIMLRAIMDEIARLNIRDGRKISIELKKAAEEAKQQLIKIARPISKQDEIERVAKISFDNPEVAKLISTLLSKIGKDGVVTLEGSNTMDITAERQDGIEFNNGYISPYMITDPQRAEANLSKPYVLVTSYRLTNANDVIPIMNALLAQGKRELLIIADNVESDALATLVINRMQGKFVGVAVQCPQVEDKQQWLDDICTMTGATLFTEIKGNRVDEATIDMLGRAEKAIVRTKKTTIVGGKGRRVDIEKAKQKIRAQLDSNIKDSEKEILSLRLARFINGVAVIKVGAPTEAEQKALKYKVEDVINSTKAAMRGGVVAGAGMALGEITTSSSILNIALKSPWQQLMKNARIDLNIGKGKTFNIVTGESGDYFKVGVIDPVEVLIAQIESAVSIASILTTTHGLLVEEPEKPKNN